MHFKLWYESRQNLTIIDDNGQEYNCDFCGRCCTGVSINSPLPGGRTFTKPAGERCIHLGPDNFCKVWGDQHNQPEVCRTIRPNNSLCRFDLRGDPEEAKKHFKYLRWLDRATQPKI